MRCILFYKIILAVKRLFRKENIYFIEDSELEQFIIDGNAKCDKCGNSISSVKDIYKVKLRKKEIIFVCKSCPEEN
jgi:formylmethanofuran dehydrogenase subunit E